MKEIYVCQKEVPDYGKNVVKAVCDLESARAWIRDEFVKFTSKRTDFNRLNFDWANGVKDENGNYEWHCAYNVAMYGWYVTKVVLSGEKPQEINR